MTKEELRTDGLSALQMIPYVRIKIFLLSFTVIHLAAIIVALLFAINYKETPWQAKVSEPVIHTDPELVKKIDEEARKALIKALEDSPKK